MKKYILSLLLSLIVMLSRSYQSEAQVPTSADPVFMTISSINQSFPLLPRPKDTNPSIGVPYESGVAFWRINGYAIDISSHCTETPGKYFQNIKVNDSIIIEFSNGNKETVIVYELIKVRYANLSNPHQGLWVDESGVEYTSQQFLEYSMLRKDNIVLHSSMCSQGFSFGQFFIFAK